VLLQTAVSGRYCQVDADLTVSQPGFVLDELIGRHFCSVDFSSFYCCLLIVLCIYVFFIYFILFYFFIFFYFILQRSTLSHYYIIFIMLSVTETNKRTIKSHLVCWAL